MSADLKPNAPETKPKRRWFRFSLQTLFVLVTITGVCAGWAAYQLNWIRQRHNYLQNTIITNTDLEAHVDKFVAKWKATCPWSLRLFGESATDYIWAPIGAEETARRLFPESILISLDREPLVWNEEAGSFSDPPAK
jgi:hypothetical protein